MRRNIFYRKIPAALAAFVLALALCCQTAAAGRALVPGGYTVGIKLYAEGLMVTEVESGTPAQQAGIRKGDVIIAADGKFLVTPEKTPSGYRIGVLVRDHIAGIGTVTYYDPETGSYGALGHGVSSLDGTQLLMMQSGYLVRSSVAEIRAGTRGTPGELHGLFDVTDTVGTVDKNTACGIFGTMTHPRQGQTVETAPAESVVTGPAEILSNVDGDQVQRFAIRIDRVDADAKNGRNLLITVTDEALLAKTGGIVQGMSGSPILQNGRLVGAVTHVLVNSPAQGYGILIDRMLQAAEG